MPTILHVRVGVALMIGASAVLFAGGLAAFFVLWSSRQVDATLPPLPVGMSLISTVAIGLAAFCCWFASRLLASGQRGNAANGVYVALLCTGAFVGVQLAERFGESSGAVPPSANVLHALFGFLTLLHLLHAILALLMLGRLGLQSWNGTLETEGRGMLDGTTNWMLYLLAVWLVLMLLMFVV
ncbi:MAG: hypothetical protein DYG96_13130 [Chlorobi bacterium CHB2]|nr:hypothetical protein [Chlorobi bacterium CHB2]